MTHSNNGLATTIQPEKETLPFSVPANKTPRDLDDIEPDEEDLIDEEILGEVIVEEDDESKAAKGAKSRRRTQTKKKHYTE
ncbi:MAG TPA: RNA polymerase sigma factor, RpoD/SigA family, partial [Planktothrix sp. UBA8402]|nr:RNA polymerase sigma factor, RpoD/SigA family [Planktothrix sp. UBA8402]